MDIFYGWKREVTNYAIYKYEYVYMCMIFGGTRGTGNNTELCAEHFLEQQHPEHGSDSLYHMMPL